MGPRAFESGGSWFRGNLHTHSDRSDGVAPPDQVIAEYRAAGYDFLVLTDHFEERWGRTVTDTAPARDNAFPALNSARPTGMTRTSTGSTRSGCPPTFPARRRASRTRPRSAGRLRRAPTTCCYPGLTNLLDFDSLALGHLHAVETYNVNAAQSWPDQAEARYAVDALLARGHRVHVTAADDAHWHHPWDRFGAWVMVRAERLDSDALLRALKAGAYYSTQGPRIEDVRVDGERVHVACSPARAVALTGVHGWRSDVAIADGLREATLDLGKLRSPYWRLTVTNAEGKRAWTNPVWLTGPDDPA